MNGKHFAAGGYTLLEILLVIVILSVTTMMVAPSFVSVSSPSIQSEARRLVQIVRLAADESMLSGRPLRLAVKKNSYSFESPDSEGEWMSVQDEMYHGHRLPDQFIVNEVRPAIGLDDKMGEEDEEPVIGRILLLPEGVRTPSEIVLSEADIHLTILIHPGPGGIRIEEASHE